MGDGRMLHLKTLYESVETEEQRKEFDKQWKQICKEMGNHYFPFHETEKPYLIKNDENVYIGTVTFVPKNPAFSIVDDFFDFHPHLPADANPMEIGKLSIKEEYRNQDNLKTIVKCIFDVVRAHNSTHIIGTINHKLYIALRRTYGMPIENLATVAKLPTCDVLAMLTDCEKLFNGGNRKMKELL